MNSRPILQLLHLVSPSLPTGAFSYSQGLEWAVEAGWVHNDESLLDWLVDLGEQSMGYVDIPLLARMYAAIEDTNQELLAHWCDLLMACRETAELRAEEQTRGRALATLLKNLDMQGVDCFQQILFQSQLAGFSFAAVSWKIPLHETALGYSWSWCENQVMAGVKIIPLGQTQGQQLLTRLHKHIESVVGQGLQRQDNEIGSATPGLALASSLHETQYTRLYRS